MEICGGGSAGGTNCCYAAKPLSPILKSNIEEATEDESNVIPVKTGKRLEFCRQQIHFLKKM
jgi:hypothetical protein